MSTVPKQVKIGYDWYDVHSWMDRFQIVKFGSPNNYTMQEPFAHITNLYYVYDSNGSQVGEFHIDNRSKSGCAADFEV